LSREAHIAKLNERIEDFMWLAESLKPVNLPEAERWREEAQAIRRERDALILSRTPEEVAALEEARGLN
jgi:hypothetical protein